MSLTYELEKQSTGSLSHLSAEAWWQGAKSILQRKLQEWIESQESTESRVLTNMALAGSFDGEVVIQIDEYDFRLLLLEASENEPSQCARRSPRLALEQLSEFQQILQSNPSTVALLLTWATDELLTIPLTIARIRFLHQHPRFLPRLLRGARPLLAVLQNLMTRQVKEWERGLDLSQRAIDAPIDVRQVFAASLEEAFQKERKRPYRQPARKEAAHRFPLQSEKRAILAVLDEALKGKSAHNLVKLLIE
jgi:hypothetical protein